MPLTIDYIPAEITLTTFFLLSAKYIPWIADLNAGQSLEDSVRHTERALITLNERSCTRAAQTRNLLSLGSDTE